MIRLNGVENSKGPFVWGSVCRMASVMRTSLDLVKAPAESTIGFGVDQRKSWDTISRSRGSFSGTGSAIKSCRNQAGELQRFRARIAELMHLVGGNKQYLSWTDEP